MHSKTKELWNENAKNWTFLARSGYDIYRDGFNTPSFLKILPDVKGAEGLDVGCGEGHNTRLLAQLGAKMTAVDFSEVFIENAILKEKKEKQNIVYSVCDATDLKFPDNRFDFITAFMSIMDISDPEQALAEIYRVLKPGGFFQFSIPHPCFFTPYRKILKNEKGIVYAFELGNYFENLNGFVDEWLFTATPEKYKQQLPKFKVPRFTRTLSEWINTLIGLKFNIEYINEPKPSEETVKKYPALQDATILAYYLHIRVRKN